MAIAPRCALGLSCVVAGPLCEVHVVEVASGEGFLPLFSMTLFYP